MTYQIIIPHFGATPQLTGAALRCLWSIRECSTDYQVILVDNGTPEEQFQYITSALRNMPHMLIRNSTNQGFVKATNQGVSFSTAPYILYMNNDAEAAPGWLEKLREPILSDPTIGLVGPLTTDSGVQGPRGRYFNLPRSQWAIVPGGRMIAFFCALQSRACLESLGLHDEDFVPYGGFGSDDAMCLKAYRNGWKIAVKLDVVCPHARRSTFHTLMSEEESKAMQVKALAKFKEMQ